MRQNEPLVLRGIIVGLLTALLHVLIVVGALPLDADQEIAVAGFIDLCGTAVLVLWGRAAVMPVAKAEAAIDQAEAHAQAHVDAAEEALGAAVAVEHPRTTWPRTIYARGVASEEVVEGTPEEELEKGHPLV